MSVDSSTVIPETVATSDVMIVKRIVPEIKRRVENENSEGQSLSTQKKAEMAIYRCEGCKGEEWLLTGKSLGRDEKLTVTPAKVPGTWGAAAASVPAASSAAAASQLAFMVC